MGKFKVGDRVRVRDDWDDNSDIMKKLVKGKSYEVVDTQVLNESSGKVESLDISKEEYSTWSSIKIRYPNGDTEWFGEGWCVKDRKKEVCVSCYKPVSQCICKDPTTKINDKRTECTVFKVGDKITMADNWSHTLTTKDLRLTYGKTYVVLGVGTDDVFVKNDTGVNSHYAPSWFILDVYKDNRKAIESFILSCKWKPRDGERYWYVESWGLVTDNSWWGDFEDKMRYQVGNCFKTREQARGVAYKFKGLMGGK